MDSRSERPEETAPESAARTPAAGVSVWVLLAGIAVSCTGAGAVVGVPLIAAGLTMPAVLRHRSARQMAPEARETGLAAASLSPPRQ
jgi:hypothetical protein